ncbi:hypothetical protein EDD16DRAFT_1618341 [Pisolithus croceorrhizus]|nr:hypothetical protein EDD16DRAFT_1618341 [Pisolithus croceorrhizus]
MTTFSPLEILTDILSTGLLFTFTQFINIVRTGEEERLFQGRLEYLNRDRRIAGLLCPSIRPVMHTEMTDEGEAIHVATPRSCLIGQEGIPSVPSSETMSSLPSSCGSWIEGLSVIGVDDKLQINCVQTTTSNSVDQAAKTDGVPADSLLPLVKKVSFSSTVTCFTYEKWHDENNEETCESFQDQYKVITGRCLSAATVETTTDSLSERASKETEGSGASLCEANGIKCRRRWSRFRVIRGRQMSDGSVPTRKTAPLIKRRMLSEEVRSLRQFATTPVDAGSQAGRAPEDAAKSNLPPAFRSERGNQQWDEPLVPKGPRVPRRKILATKVRHLMSRLF